MNDQERVDLSRCSAQDVIDGNELAREHLGKPLEDCTADDLRQIRDRIDEQLLFLRLERDVVIDDLAELTGLDRANLFEDDRG